MPVVIIFGQLKLGEPSHTTSEAAPLSAASEKSRLAQAIIESVDPEKVLALGAERTLRSPLTLPGKGGVIERPGSNLGRTHDHVLSCTIKE